MTKQSFDELISLLDEVVSEGKADQIEVDDGLIYGPVEVFQQRIEPVINSVPSSPPGASPQLILPSSSSEKGRIDGDR